MTAVIVIVIILVLIGVLAVALISIYNGFVKERNKIQESWRQVDVELNRRYELLPNLVETVRGYAAHERNTLEDVTRLRGQAQALAQAGGTGPSEERAQVEEQLSGAVRGLMVSVEAYPDLKSNRNFLELQRQLTETEDRIANGRRFYNANVRAYNTRVESVPSNIIAGMFNFTKASYFEVTDPQARVAPDVNFGEIAYRGDQPQALPQQQSSAGQGAYQPQSYQQPAPPQQPYPQQQPPGQQPPQQGQPGRQQPFPSDPGQQQPRS